ncbi:MULTISPECIES: protein kinase family protein [Arcobacteraceae]|uniref:hypothetical protein n=1 Tax=Arcobacteraceae TaxID=2808963 RepID=UPI00081EA7F3|nr:MULTISPECIES: hypothetical protein [Arcobacteraceae]MDX4050973.1 hypothetical protein [Aliarcobacter skirrowii]OCL83924.1 3-deoxy-D-manno-octulosonic-acid kinase [Arcobacter porcinus]
MSKYKYEINEDFKEFKKNLINIKKDFENSELSIHKARNELKVIEFNKCKLIVKSFKIPNLINKIVYVYFRDSKAKKSYFNALKLIEKNILTPKPVAYIEFYKNGMLNDSYYVSEEIKYDFLIREPLYNKDFKDRENILKQFVCFTYKNHKKGVFHKDYSAGNILVSKKDSGIYDFYLVDINRMQFCNIDIKKAMLNFNKFWSDEPTLKFIAKEYSTLSGYDEQECISLILHYDTKLKNFVQRRRKLKKMFFGE